MLIKNGVTRRRLLEISNSAILLYPLLRVLNLSEAKAAGAILPRAIFTHFSCGTYPEFFWNSNESGALTTLPPLLAPMEAHKSDLILLKGLCTRGGTNHDGAPAQVLAGWGKKGAAMPGAETSTETPYSLDQMLADKWGDKTIKKSILLGSGTSFPTLNNFISYNSSGVGVPCVDNPRGAFDSIFGGFSLSSGGSGALQLASANVTSGRKRLIDYLRGDLKKISGSMGAMESQMFEAHVTALDEIAKEIGKQDALGSPDTGGTPSSTPSDSGNTSNPDNNSAANGGPARLASCDKNIPGINTDITQYAEVRRINNLIMVQALACGITRVGVMAHSVSDTTLDYGGNGNYHLSSHANSPGFLNAQVAFMTTIAELITQLKAVKTATGTLFDETLVTFASDLGEDPNAHVGVNVPAFLVGNLGGKLKGGKQIVFPFTPGDWSSTLNGMDYNRFLISIAALLDEPGITEIGNTAYKGTIKELLG